MHILFVSSISAYMPRLLVMYREISDQYFSVQTLHSVNKKLTLGLSLLKNGNKFEENVKHCSVYILHSPGFHGARHM